MSEPAFSFGDPPVGESNAPFPPEKAIDVVFISEGFKADQLAEYQDWMEHTFWDHFSATEPFNRYTQFFHPKWVNLISGSTKSAVRGGTALDWGVFTAAGGTLMVDMLKVKEVLQAQPEDQPEGQRLWDTADVVVVLVNTERAGHPGVPDGDYLGLGVTARIIDAMGWTRESLTNDIAWPIVDGQKLVAIPFTPEDKVDFGHASGIAIVPRMAAGTIPAEEVALHEFAHAFASLCDEYELTDTEWVKRPFSKVIAEGHEHDLPNVVALYNDGIAGHPQLNYEVPSSVIHWDTKKLIKWRYWISPFDTSPVPPGPDAEPADDPPAAYNGVNLWVGGGYESIDGNLRRAAYRPERTCKMRDGNVPFCRVCREALIYAIYNHPDAHAIMGTTPDAGAPVQVFEGPLSKSVRITSAVDLAPIQTTVYVNWAIAPSGGGITTPTIDDLEVAERPLTLRVDAVSGDVLFENHCRAFPLMPDWEAFNLSATVLDDAFQMGGSPWILPAAREDPRSEEELMQEEWKREATVTWPVTVTFAPILSADSAWPTARHDMQRTGRAHTNGPINLTGGWLSHERVAEGCSPVLGDDGTLYVAGSDSGVLALDLATGDLRLRLASDRRMMTPVVGLAEGRRTIFGGSSDGSVYVWDAETGEPRWNLQPAVPGSDSRPGALALGKSGTIYVQGIEIARTGDLPELRLKAVRRDGVARWSQRLSALTTEDSERPDDDATPAIGPEGLIHIAHHVGQVGYLVTCRPDSSACRSRRIGERGDADIGYEDVLRGPAVSGGRVFVAMGCSIVACDAWGEELWRFKYTWDIGAGPLIGEDGRVYVGAGTRVYSLDPAGGDHPSTFVAEVTSLISCLAMDDAGTLYVGAEDQTVHAIPVQGPPQAFDLATWPCEGIPTSLAVGDGVLFVVAGNQVCAIAEGMKIKARNCDIRVTDSKGRSIGPAVKGVRPRKIPGATYEAAVTSGAYTVTVSIPGPIRDSMYGVKATRPAVKAKPGARCAIVVEEGTRSIALAKGLTLAQVSTRPYRFRYPSPATPSPGAKGSGTPARVRRIKAVRRKHR